jgi:L,D-transpeptidase catalytic domain
MLVRIACTPRLLVTEVHKALRDSSVEVRGSARNSNLASADFSQKDALAVFDMSQPAAKKRLYVLDFKSTQVTAHYAAHGRHNGPNARAVKFKGFQKDFDMAPFGPQDRSFRSEGIIIGGLWTGMTELFMQT